ncbi:hypothetical protein M3Y99_00646500 [Aphelenchoides fujianensis]|nr:hypothetical protein M3Y99_00646500 [Aphelenchoides fujianensis]
MSLFHRLGRPLSGWIRAFRPLSTKNAEPAAVESKGAELEAADVVDALGEDEEPQGQEMKKLKFSYSQSVLAKFKFDTYPFYVEREWWKHGKRMTFWATWRMRRDVIRRHVLAEWGPERMRLKALKWNTVLPQAIRDECAERLDNLPRYAHPQLILNMCQFTGRQRGKIKPYRVNRHIFRRLADHGQLSGVQRATW